MARINSCRSAHASGWLLPRPFEERIEGWLSPAEFTTAARFRLGLPVADGTTLCRMCLKHDADVMGNHSLLCLAGGHRSKLHNDVRDTVFRFASMALMNPRREDPCFGATSLRSDVTLTNVGRISLHGSTVQRKPIAIDITITHFASLGGVRLAAREPAGAANAMMVLKQRKYAAIAEAAGVDLAPVAIDTLGAICSSGVDVLRRIAMRWGNRFDIKPPRSIPIVMQRISSIVMRGICRLLLINAMPPDAPLMPMRGGATQHAPSSNNPPQYFSCCLTGRS
jgi:hypothetical protein